MATHELVFGSHGTLRRQLSAFVLAVIVATAARELAFADWVFGSHLRTNLGPLERPDAGYTLLLAARAWDTLMQLAALWPNAASNDGFAYGVLYALVSRFSLQAFQHLYFRLSLETCVRLLATDAFAYALSSSVIALMVPHSIAARASKSVYSRLKLDKVGATYDMLVALATAGAAATLTGYVAERLGGFDFVKSHTGELSFPSALAAGELTPAEILAHPTLTLPALRLKDLPLSMLHHVALSAPTSMIALLLSLSHARLSALSLSALTLLAAAPTTALALHDTMPIDLLGATVVGGVLALRLALATLIVSVLLPALREDVAPHRGVGASRLQGASYAQVAATGLKDD